jgi:hypothetical protein
LTTRLARPRGTVRVLAWENRLLGVWRNPRSRLIVDAASHGYDGSESASAESAESADSVDSVHSSRAARAARAPVLGRMSEENGSSREGSANCPWKMCCDMCCAICARRRFLALACSSGCSVRPRVDNIGTTVGFRGKSARRAGRRTASPPGPGLGPDQDAQPRITWAGSSVMHSH